MGKKNKKKHTVGTVSKSNRKIVKTESKSTPLTDMYMTSHFPVFVQTLQ
jgi:hypothetical protein